jgi:hypothetical protein
MRDERPMLLRLLLAKIRLPAQARLLLPKAPYQQLTVCSEVHRPTLEVVRLSAPPSPSAAQRVQVRVQVVELAHEGEREQILGQGVLGRLVARGLGEALSSLVH